MSEKPKSKCIDTLGHRIDEGDWVTIMPQPNTIWVARVKEVSNGGIAIAIDKKQNAGITLARVRVVLDITLSAPPGITVFPNILKTTPPNSDAILDKIMEEVEKNPPPPETDPDAN